MQISRRSQQKFADFATNLGSRRTIEQVYEAHNFFAPADFEPTEGRVRRSVCEAHERGLDLADPTVSDRLLRVYVDAIEDWGRNSIVFGGTPGKLPDDALALIRALQQDQAPIDDDGNLVLGSVPVPLAVERFDRLSEPRVLLEHLRRIESGIATDPAAAIGSSKELVESALKFVLNDYGVEYPRNASLPDLYKAVAKELRLSRESVPESAKGSAAAQRVLQNLATAVQGLAEMRNEIGLGHGRTTPSPALARHARLSANAARTLVEFVLDTWHARRGDGPSTDPAR